MVDVTDMTFEAEVLQRSMTSLVIVDLWAPWCGPCKSLGPILEKVIGQTNGQAVLAKINVDENPQASAAFKVQSIPAVYALKEGQVIDGFMGAKPESEVRDFVNKHLDLSGVSPVDELIIAGDEPSLRRALELDPTSKSAVAALAQLLLAEGRTDEAVEVLETLPEDEELAALLTAARSAALPDEAKSKIQSELAILLPTVKSSDDDRASFISLLDDLAIGDPSAAADWRRKLSAQLF